MGRTVILLVLILWPFASALGQEATTADLIAKAPDAAKYPQAGAIYLLNSVLLKVDEKFGSTREVRQVVKILNSRGIAAFGQITADYDSKDETIEILKAVTIDGKSEVAAKGDAITEVTPPELTAANLYSNVKRKVISMAGLKDGVVIEVAYRVTRREPMVAGKFWDTFLFQAAEPMQTVEYSVVLPKGVKFKHVVERAACTPIVAKGGDPEVYHWRMKDVDGIVPETAMPPLVDFAPRLHITNWDSWAEIGAWYAKLSAPSLQATDAIKAWVAELAKGKADPESRMAAVYHAVASRIRYVGLEFGIGGYKPHAATEILENKYGDCKDKASLLLAAFSEIGVKGHLVLINASVREVNADMPSPGAFNHAIAAIPVDKGWLWLDPTSETCSFRDLPVQDQGKSVLIVVDGKGELVKIPLAPATRNLESLAFDGEVTAGGGLKGTCTWKVAGFFNLLYRSILKQMKPEERAQWLGMVAAQISEGLKVKESTFSDVEDLSIPIAITFTFECESFVTEAADMLMLKFPDMVGQLAQMTAAKDRKYPFVLGLTTATSREVTLRVPAGHKIQSLPKGAKVENKVGKYVSTYTEEKGVIKARRDFAIDMDRIGPADYAMLKELASAVSKETSKQAALKKE